jgi:hypothetical protein
MTRRCPEDPFRRVIFCAKGRGGRQWRLIVRSRRAGSSGLGL